MSELATLAALFAAFAGIIALLLFVATWLCIALAAGVLGDRKGRCGACWFVACLVAPPLILPLLACSYLRPEHDVDTGHEIRGQSSTRPEPTLSDAATSARGRFGA